MALQIFGLKQIEESNSNETTTNLVAVGSNHLYRDRLGAGHKDRRSCECAAAATVAAADYTCGRPEGIRRHRPEGKLLCRGKGRPRCLAAASGQPAAQGVG